MASKDFSWIACHRGPPPRVSLLAGQLSRRALLQSRSGASMEVPGAAPLPCTVHAGITLFFLPAQRCHRLGLSCRALACVGSEVVCVMTPRSVPCCPRLHSGCLSMVRAFFCAFGSRGRSH